LGIGVVQAEEDSWKADTALMLYNEKDRVQAVEPVISLTKSLPDEKKLSFKLVLDSLTGASPNGALPTNQVQTFTRPSGHGSYDIKAGDAPLDDTFKDTRGAFSVQWEQPLDRLLSVSAGVNISAEYDYQSLGTNASIARDFNQKNTTASVGFAYSSDTIEPEGDIPLPFSSMVAAGTTQPRQGTNDSKTVLDLLFGVTQIINRKTLMQVNYSYSKSDGYLTDPFKLLSVVDATTGETLDYVYENRPDTRVKNSIFWKTKYFRDSGHVIDVSYRFMKDDWEITSHTVDFHYRWPFGELQYIEPHLRYYTQDEADFYTHSLISDSSLPVDASNDPRLGSFVGTTIGVKYGLTLAGGAELSFRLESYQQKGDIVGQVIGQQANQDLFPDLDAIIAQVSYSFRW